LRGSWGQLLVRHWQTIALFVSAFLLGWIIWPDASGWTDGAALLGVAFSVTGLTVILDQATMI
jgi:hypothetical protein